MNEKMGHYTLIQIQHRFEKDRTMRTTLQGTVQVGPITLWTCPICGGKTSDEYISCDFCGENSIPKEPKNA